MERAELTALIIKAQSGDQGAMEEVLRTAHTSVSYQCRKLLRDPRDAEDITQEILLTVYTKLDTLKNPATFWGWLNTTTANRCMDVLRRGNVELQFAEDEEGHSVLDNLEEVDEQQVPDKSLDNAETTRMIEEIVNSLPEAQRICVLMYYYDEMSVRDIAAALGVPENTVKSRLNYARKAVKEQVLDYEKKGVKLYGMSPLPFMLFFLLRAAEKTADSAKAAAAAKQVMELGVSAAAGAGGTAAGAAAAGGSTAAGAAASGTAVAAGTTAAAGTVAANAAGGLSAKLIAGVLAGLLLAGGAGVAVVGNTGAPVVGGAGAAIADAAQNAGQPDPAAPAEGSDDRIPADRLALLNDITYYGDPAQCRMTVSQARAYAEVIETRSAELVPAYEGGTAICHAALIDVGEGNPVLVLVCGTIYGEINGGYIGGGNPGPNYHSGLDGITGKLEVWRYADGQAEQIAATHEVYWKEGEGLVCHTHTGGTNDENGDVLPMEAQSHYLDFSEDVYRVEGGVISASPIASALVEIDLREETVSFDDGGIIDGQPVGKAVWPAWRQQWDEGGRKSIIIAEDWVNWSQYWGENGWTRIGISYDVTIGGYVDDGAMNFQTVSPGADAADVLRRCAGE